MLPRPTRSRFTASRSSILDRRRLTFDFDQPVSEMVRGQYWIHPALTEVVENALLGLDLNPVEDLIESPPLA